MMFFFEKGCLKYSDYTLINLKKYKNIIIWKKIEIINNTLHLEGIDNLWITKDYKYFCKIGNKTYYPEIVKYNSHDLITLFGIFDEGKVIIFNIKLEEIFTHIIYMYISFFNISTEIFSNPGYLSRLPSIPDGYYISENYIIKMINKRITLYPNTWNNANNFENLYLKQLNKLGLYNIIKLRKRIIRYKNNKYIKKEIWIINDEKDKAGDNGEYLDFEKNDVFEIKESCDYQELIKESSLLITDYSSIFFDFAYLKKPVIYTHFDYNEYRENHVPEGYFNYKNDGFGPICNIFLFEILHS